MVDTSVVGDAGALSAREDGTDSGLLLREADAAMFEGKKTGQIVRVGRWAVVAARAATRRLS